MSRQGRQLIQGNMACLQGAIYAGMRFFAGYPITPSTEIAEGSARELPKIGGRFIQMEDEIASIAAVIGASVAGTKGMTATSGPGYSLMSENIGYAYMTETPCVIVNVQRGGPSTGMPTKISQSDTMQARWGTHGDFTSITVAPSSVADSFTETVRAFNLAERFRTPVTILLDEVIGHMREMISLPQAGELEIIDRVRPSGPPEEFVPFAITDNLVSPMPEYGDGYRFNVTGLTHDERGFGTDRPEEVIPMLDKLRNKIDHYHDEIVKLRLEQVDDADIILIGYGSVARAALQAVAVARSKGVKVGLAQLCTIWPFPDKKLREVCSRCRKVIVGELNMGQIVHEVRRVLPPDISVHSLARYDGEILTPAQILEKIEEIL